MRLAPALRTHPFEANDRCARMSSPNAGPSHLRESRSFAPAALRMTALARFAKSGRKEIPPFPTDSALAFAVHLFLGSLVVSDTGRATCCRWDDLPRDDLHERLSLPLRTVNPGI